MLAVGAIVVVTQKARRMPSIDGCQCFVLKIGGEECVRAAAQPNSKPQTTSIFFFTLHIHIQTGVVINDFSSNTSFFKYKSRTE